ncbi:MAG: hypothetical protein AB7F43_11830 [Bacteriovoracia bacterium]
MVIRLAISIITIFCFISCNLFSSLDSETLVDSRDKLSAAHAKANQSDCQGAIDILSTIPYTEMNDEVLASLGWAYLCSAGATIERIAGTIYTYSSTNPNYAVVGQLARNLIPMTEDKIKKVDIAISLGSRIVNKSQYAFFLSIAKLIAAATLLSTQASNTGSSTNLEPIDIDTSCSINCTSCSNPGMTDTNISTFYTHLAQAAQYADLNGSTELRSLLLGLLTNLTTTASTARCFIYRAMIPSS